MPSAKESKSIRDISLAFKNAVRRPRKRRGERTRGKVFYSTHPKFTRPNFTQQLTLEIDFVFPEAGRARQYFWGSRCCSRRCSPDPVETWQENTCSPSSSSLPFSLPRRSPSRLTGLAIQAGTRAEQEQSKARPLGAKTRVRMEPSASTSYTSSRSVLLPPCAQLLVCVSVATHAAAGRACSTVGSPACFGGPPVTVVKVGVASTLGSAHSCHESSSPYSDIFGAERPAASQEWPGSFCDSKQGCVWPIQQPTLGWTLHGLWPEFNDGTWPQYCDKTAPFNVTSLDDLRPELEAYWPSLMSKDFPAFWAHEWTRHGTCCEALTPQVSVSSAAVFLGSSIW